MEPRLAEQFEAACEADLILVEGAMGLFDGEPSSADLAALCPADAPPSTSTRKAPAHAP